MKAYERSVGARIDGYLPWIVRLDGHCFSSFTRAFSKPFDVRLASAMVHTTEDLVRRFAPATAFTQSDEISLLFPPCTAHQTPLFSGKVQKIVSVLSSFAGVRFNAHLTAADFGGDTAAREQAHSATAHFDARVFNVPTRAEALNNFLWRHLFDCRRNSISALAHSLFPHAELQGLPTRALLHKMRVERGVVWEEQPRAFTWGTFVKQEQFLRSVDASALPPAARAAAPAAVLRTRTAARAIDLGEASPDTSAELLFAKFWPTAGD